MRISAKIGANYVQILLNYSVIIEDRILFLSGNTALTAHKHHNQEQYVIISQIYSMKLMEEVVECSWSKDMIVKKTKMTQLQVWLIRVS